MKQPEISVLTSQQGALNASADAVTKYFQRLETTREADLQRIEKAVGENRRLNWLQRNSGVMTLVIVVVVMAGTFIYVRKTAKQA